MPHRVLHHVYSVQFRRFLKIHNFIRRKRSCKDGQAVRLRSPVHSLKVTNCQTNFESNGNHRPLPASRFLQRFSFYFERCSCHTDSCATGTNLLVKLSILSENIPTTCPSIDVPDYTCVLCARTHMSRANIRSAHVLTQAKLRDRLCFTPRSRVRLLNTTFEWSTYDRLVVFWISILADCTREIPARGGSYPISTPLFLFFFFFSSYLASKSPSNCNPSSIFNKRRIISSLDRFFSIFAIFDEQSMCLNRIEKLFSWSDCFTST